MEDTRRLPPELAEHARAFTTGRRDPAPARDAATVVLLRAGPRAVEVYLIRRHEGMAFAPGAYVFPGGSVDRRDAEVDVAWAGPSPDEWAARLSCDESSARGLVCAAVRETFEESGVLLAGRSPAEVVADTTGADWEREREALVRRDLSFAAFLRRRELVLRSDLLAAWSRWITPEFEPRRYDTRFFVAVLPEGQRTRNVSTEADAEAWLRPDDVVARVDDGVMAMLPPTYITMREMAGLADPPTALARARSREIRPILPEVEFDGDGALLRAELP